MLLLTQRVRQAHVVIDQKTVGAIDQGLLVFVCAQATDTEATLQKAITKLLKLRIFNDEAGKMNRSVTDMQGGLLLVSQFTLAADTQRGNRPSFTQAAPPELSKPLFERMVTLAHMSHPKVAAGEFAADMQVHLINDGPVTIPMTIT